MALFLLREPRQKNPSREPNGGWELAQGRFQENVLVSDRRNWTEHCSYPEKCSSPARGREPNCGSAAEQRFSTPLVTLVFSIP